MCPHSGFWYSGTSECALVPLGTGEHPNVPSFLFVVTLLETTLVRNPEKGGGLKERGALAFACQYIVSPRGRSGNRSVTHCQMRHPLLVEG